MAKKLAISPIAGTKNRVFVKPAPAEDGKKPVVKVGDVVLYGKYSGTEISFEGQDFLSMRESDIIARF
jgi:chaperonin GroES